MSRRLDDFLPLLNDCDLKMAAFECAETLRGGVYPKTIAYALDLFTNLPCPETAVILVSAWPEIAPILVCSDNAFNRVVANLPEDMRGPHYERFEKWMDSFDRNLRAAEAIHEFIRAWSTKGTISVGFHRMRNQQILFDRLRMIGIRKGLLKNGRQFLRDTITREVSAFRAVNDLICIHGIDNTGERFWNALGGETDPQWWSHSEILYDVSSKTTGFVELVDQFSRPAARPIADEPRASNTVVRPVPTISIPDPVSVAEPTRNALESGHQELAPPLIPGSVPVATRIDGVVNVTIGFLFGVSFVVLCAVWIWAILEPALFEPGFGIPGSVVLGLSALLLGTNTFQFVRDGVRMLGDSDNDRPYRRRAHRQTSHSPDNG